MKPLFELPELLTLNGDPLPGGMDAVWGKGHACGGGCADGCCDGCVTGYGDGKNPEDPIG